MTLPELDIIAIALGIGLLTGFINTLAGSGSLLVLPFFIFAGLPAPVANGTNRVGLMMQTLIGALSLQRSTGMPLLGSWRYIVPALIGAIAGAAVAVEVDKDAMYMVIGVIMTVMLIPLLINGKKFLQEAGKPNYNTHLVKMIPIMLAIGFYGGFIQAGVGIFVLFALVMVSGFSLRQANVVKNLLIFCWTVPSLIIFAYNGQVDWTWGIIMAIGQSLGSFLAGRYAARLPGINQYIRILLIIIVIASIVKMFELHTLLPWW